MKVGIVGFGYVGQALHALLSEDVSVALYDIGYQDLRELKAMEGADFIFMALPTPNTDQGEQCMEAIESFFRLFDETFPLRLSWNPIFILKSTVLPSNLRPFLERYRLVVNPEFLSQNHAFEDSLHQKTVILGGRRDLTSEVESFYKKWTTLKCEFEHMSEEEAANFKYIRNIYGAYKVLFWNWVQEQTGNARKYAHLYKKFPQGEMSQIAPDGERGFGGACFPKDIQAFHSANPHPLTQFIQDYNKRLRKDADE